MSKLLKTTSAVDIGHCARNGEIKQNFSSKLDKHCFHRYNFHGNENGESKEY